jgi:hypothetical protein
MLGLSPVHQRERKKKPHKTTGPEATLWSQPIKLKAPKILFFFLLGGTGVWTQGLTVARQAS